MATTNVAESTARYLLQFDGGSRGNPGIAGSGAVIYDLIPSSPGKAIWKGFTYIGDKSTNNQAEYTGLIIGLEAAIKLKLTGLQIEGDSKLVVMQMLGEFKVSSPNIKALYAKAKALQNQLPSCSFKHIRRELNSEADALSNMAMDMKTTLLYVTDPVA